jgi:hypothetical protein
MVLNKLHIFMYIQYIVTFLTVTSQIMTVLSLDAVASFVPSWENRKNNTYNRKF